MIAKGQGQILMCPELSSFAHHIKSSFKSFQAVQEWA
jgi:hypothetical protein